MAIVESLEMRKRLCCGSMERELHISRKEIQELLMERLTKWTDLNCFLSDIKMLIIIILFFIQECFSAAMLTSIRNLLENRISNL